MPSTPIPAEQAAAEIESNLAYLEDKSAQRSVVDDVAAIISRHCSPAPIDPSAPAAVNYLGDLINAALYSRSERAEVLEEAAKIVDERTSLWAARWGQNIRAEFREEARHRKDATLALGEDAAAVIRALITEEKR